jgi:23S rRNA pseudouridine2605 synthase/16S rRNA pseudouridine516 synthase
MARAGVMPLDEAEAAIRAGVVTINGRAVRQPMTLLPEGAVVKVRGHPVELVQSTHVLAFHKPKDCLTSTMRQRNVGTVFELLLPTLSSELSRFHWHAVGRLDKDTTGLLLFTNDERLVAHATDPKARLPKRYVATVQGHADDAKVEPLRRGLMLEDGLCRPARVTVRDEKTVEVTITQGRHHQVKRMLGSVGLPVNALHREAIGTLELDLPVGAWRELTEAEVQSNLRFDGVEPQPPTG